MDKKEILLNLKKKILNGECNLENLVSELDINELEVLGMVKELKDNGENISVTRKKDGVYIEDFGDIKSHNHNTKTLHNDEKVIKFLLISDTRLCSKFSQLSILNDLYKKAYDMGVRHVFHLGDIVEGIYFGKYKKYNQTVLHHNPDTQAMYVKRNYPYIKDMTTYFITGEHDLSFLKTKEREDVGEVIGQLREDLVYLGQESCMIYLESDHGKPIKIDLRHPLGNIAYTVSYKPQRIVDAMRSEERPDIMTFGHFLVHDTFIHHDVLINQVPSCCATTPEMTNRGTNNILGATILTLYLDNKNRITKTERMFLNYRNAIPNDYRFFISLTENDKKLVKELR